MRRIVYGLIGLLLLSPAFAQDAAEIKVWVAFSDYRFDWTKDRAAEFDSEKYGLPGSC